MENMTFGQRIVHYRKKILMSQKNFAEKVGISPTALNYYEKDKREPNVFIIKKIANALGITGDQLLGIQSSNAEEIKIPDLDEEIIRKFLQLNQRNKIKIEGKIDDYLDEQQRNNTEFAKGLLDLAERNEKN